MGPKNEQVPVLPGLVSSGPACGAERAGFEPARHLSAPNGLANRKQGGANHKFQKDFGKASPALAVNGQCATPDDPDLAAVIEAWPTLPEPIRAGIVAMVESCHVVSPS